MPGLYRKVSCAYWQGELAEALRGDAVAHTVAFYLMTCPSTNQIGCYRLALATIADDVGYASETCLEAVGKLSEMRFCTFDERFRMVFVREFARHEWGESPNAKRNEVVGLRNSLPLLMSVCPKSFVWNDFWDRYGEPWAEILEGIERPDGTRLERVGNASRTPRGRMPNQDQDQEGDQDPDQDSSCAERGEDAATAPPVNLGEPVAWMPYTGPDPTKRAHRPVEGVDEDGRRELAVYALDVETLAKAYPGVNMETELQAARAWLVTHKSRRKTAGGMTAYLRTWMQKAQNGSAQVPVREKPCGRFSQPHTLNRGDLDKLIDF